MRAVIQSVLTSMPTIVINNFRSACKWLVAAKLYLFSATSLAQQCIQDLSSNDPNANNCGNNNLVYIFKNPDPSPVSFVGDCLVDLSAANPGSCDQPQPVPSLAQPLLVALILLVVGIAALGRLVARKDQV